ncbi:MAG: glycine--tRNA ligase subunit beta [Vicinamibacterales bacterium]
MDRELLLEIGVEELPAGWLPALATQLAEVLRGQLEADGLPTRTAIEAHATPRRLVACVPELVDRQEDRDETLTGPPVSAAFDAEGHPTSAGLGFARKLGVDFDALVPMDTPRGKYLSYQRHTRGRATVDVLPAVVGRVLRALSFPKHMQWDALLDDGHGAFPFGRPIRWLLLLYGGRVVPFTIVRQSLASSPRVQDVASGAVTYGHRFLATSGRAGRAIKVRSFAEYQKKLAENFVILSRIERRDRVMRDLEAQARRIGGRALLQDHAAAEALLDEVPDLVEYPGVVAGAFPEEFLSLPSEVLTTTLIHHQHFFPVTDTAGALMPAFLAVTNTQPANDRAIATNAERVVAARLRDARFFWDADRAIGLEARLGRLETLTFHKKLGSYGDKARRLEALARWIAAEVLDSPDQADAAARAGRLAKADLATDMVRELTELQGQMGGIYAREAGEPEAVWRAIYHHYLPIAIEANASPRPEALGAAGVSWAAVSLADKLDTLVGLFLAGERPTGSRDPFGLRRAAHGVLRILLDAQALANRPIRQPLDALMARAQAGYDREAGDAPADLARFMGERLESVLIARGHERNSVRCALASRRDGGPAPVADVAGNLEGLAAFAKSEQFRQLATAFKRVRNIARELPDGDLPSEADLAKQLKEPAEQALLKDLAERREAIEAAARDGHGYHEAYASAAGFEPAVARFFDDVFVMTDDAALRRARLGLMKRLEHVILQLGDISELVAAES